MRIRDREAACVSPCTGALFAPVANLAGTEAHEISPAALAAPGTAPDRQQKFPGIGGPVISGVPQAQLEVVALGTAGIYRIKRVPDVARKPVIAITAAELKKAEDLRYLF